MINTNGHDDQAQNSAVATQNLSDSHSDEDLRKGGGWTFFWFMCTLAVWLVGTPYLFIEGFQSRYTDYTNIIVVLLFFGFPIFWISRFVIFIIRRRRANPKSY